MIPKTGWKPIIDAPRDGSIIIARYREFNAKDGKPAIQPVQWLCDYSGANWGWKKPWHMGTAAHADEWMTLDEFKAAQNHDISMEFDL